MLARALFGRMAAASIAVAGCGRLGFDPTGDGGPSDGNAGADADASLPCTTDYIVDTPVDDPSLTCAGGGCSLRGALQVAPAAAVICLDDLQVQLEAEIVITRSVTIRGGGHVQRAPGANHRLFRVDAPGELVLESLSLSGGAIVDEGGGAVRVSPFANLHLDRVNVFDNNADAVTVGVEGGAILIDADGGLAVRRSVFDDNGAFSNVSTSARGGAIAIHPGQPVVIEDTTFSSNQATDAGGALYIQAEGVQFTARRNLFLANSSSSGAAADVNCDATGTIAFESSTFTENESPASVIFVCSDTTVALESCTFVGNNATLIDFAGSGGNGTVLFTSSILDNGIRDICSGAGSGVSMGNNIREGVDGACAFQSAGDAIADPQLLPLADNGGPTRTLLPMPTSPVIDAAGSGCPAIDQRGVARPQGAACDIGAIEVE